MPVSSHPVWGAWIEIWKLSIRSEATVSSHPVWGAWIEIGSCIRVLGYFEVAPRVGCVD